MSYDTLVDKINKIKKIDPELIIEKKIKSKKLFLLNPKKYNFADLSLEAHSIINERCLELIEKVNEEMKSDIYFRNFICCNLQFFLHQNKTEFSNFIDDYDVITKGELNSILKVSFFGFLNPKKDIKLDDEEKQHFFMELTNFYLKSLKRLTGNFLTDYSKLNFKKHIIEPILKIVEIVDLPADCIEIRGNDYIEINCDYEDMQNFLAGLQLHMFYENFINSIIEDNTSGELIKNPVILVNPQYNRKIEKIQGYMEFDGFIYLTENEIYFIECKNSWIMKFSDVTQFIGKCWHLEKIYNITIEKCCVSTGKFHDFFYGYWEYKSFKEIHLFDLKNHIKNYKFLKNFFKNI